MPTPAPRIPTDNLRDEDDILVVDLFRVLPATWGDTMCSCSQDPNQQRVRATPVFLPHLSSCSSEASWFESCGAFQHPHPTGSDRHESSRPERESSTTTEMADVPTRQHLDLIIHPMIQILPFAIHRSNKILLLSIRYC